MVHRAAHPPSSASRSGAPVPATPGPGPQGTGWGLVRSPLLWGGLLTVGVYQLVPHLPILRSTAQRYLCSHPLEYTLVTLFCIGVTILLQKVMQLNREWSALRQNPLNHQTEALRSEQSLADAAEQLEQSVSRLPSRLLQTHVISRLQEACHYVRRATADADSRHT